MKLGPITKIDKRNKTTSKKFDDGVISEKWDVIVIFPAYGQFGAVRKPDSGGVVCKNYITALTLLHRVKVLFLPRSADYLQKKY